MSTQISKAYFSDSHLLKQKKEGIFGCLRFKVGFLASKFIAKPIAIAITIAAVDSAKYNSVGGDATMGCGVGVGAASETVKAVLHVRASILGTFEN